MLERCEKKQLNDNSQWLAFGNICRYRKILSEAQKALEDGGVSARITKIISMDGDVDVSQRKGKVITLFDVKLQLEYEGGSTG